MEHESNFLARKKEADRLYDEEKYDEAMKLYLKLLDMVSDGKQLAEIEYRISGCLYYYYQDEDEALEHINKAIELDNANAYYYHLRGTIYYYDCGFDHFPDAIKDYETAIKLLDGENGEWYYSLGDAYWQNWLWKDQVGDYDKLKALEYFKKAEKIKNFDAWEYSSYAELLIECELFEEAEEKSSLMLSLDRDRQHIYEKFMARCHDGKNSKLSHPKNSDVVDEEISLSDLMGELNDLIGLDTVKNEVNTIINLLRINKVRAERGMKHVPTSKHLVFSGNPGTGKTTIARILAKIYKELGVLSKGQLIEVDRSKLVAGYVGQTAIQTQEMIQKAMGGILFIDEAYTLSSSKGSNDFGQEAIDTILKAMEDNRDDFVVIVAGYPDLMQEFLNSNPGLRSRFNKFINFEDYTPDELTAIFNVLCEKSGYAIDDEIDEYLHDYFVNKYNNRDRNFANGREVRNFFEVAVSNQANRLATDPDLTDEELITLTIEDVRA